MLKKLILTTLFFGIGTSPFATMANPIEIKLAVSQHRALPKKLSNSRVDAIFREMSKIVTKADSGSDVSCRITFKRSGNVGEFIESEVPFSISSRADFRKVNDKDSSIKVVGEINWCSTLGVNIIGCASRPGSSMAVIRIPNLKNEAILWAHEYGHTTGSPHRNVAKQIMRPRLRQTMVELNATECNRMLTQMNLDPTSPMGMVSEDEVIAIEASSNESSTAGDVEEVEAFVGETFFEGVPYNQAIKFDAEDVPILISIIDNPERVENWANSVATLGAIGTEEAEKALLDFLFDQPSADLTAIQYLAKSNVPVALGWLAARDEDNSALTTLINATNSDWWVNVARIDWKTPIHADRNALIQSLVTKSIIGLTLSGSEEAAIRLRELEAQIDPDAPDRMLGPNESTVMETLNAETQKAITFVSPETRNAVVNNGGAEFIEAQEVERAAIQEKGLLMYYQFGSKK